MTKLASLRPTNEASERHKFLSSLAAGEHYDPQFQYKDVSRAEEARSECDVHLSDEFADLAAAVLNGIVADHGSEEKYQATVWGPPLDSKAVTHMCDSYIALNGLVGKCKCVWAPETLVTMCSGGKVFLVTRANYYRQLRLLSLLDHEIGTHFVRSYNHKKTFAGRKWKHHKGWLLATEEGLATLNTHREYSDKRFWIPALHYLACLLASRLPFSELWRELAVFLGTEDHERLWTTCLRVKRGLIDTGKPGGYYKDQSNFAGAIRLLQQRQSIEFDLLHCARVSVEDLPSALGSAKSAMRQGAVLRPSFVRNLETYRLALEEMAAANGVR